MNRGVRPVPLTRWRVAAAGWIAANVTVASPSIPEGEPLASLDLAVTEDVRLLDAEWRYSDVRIVSKPFYEANADGQPSRTKHTAYANEDRIYAC